MASTNTGAFDGALDGILDRYQSYVEAFNGDITKGTGFSWTPYRFCSEDWLLAVVVVRASRHSYEVALVESENHQDFEPEAGLKAGLSFMLADSFYKTGKMEIRFCGPKRDQAPTLDIGFCRGIPGKIRGLSESLGVKLANYRVLTHEEGQRLYCAMVGLNQPLAKQFSELGVDPTRTAFLLHRGNIAKESLQLIADHSSRPNAILEGRLVPDRWLAFKRELLLLRRGILAERVRVVFELGAKVERETIDVTWLDSSTISLSACCEINLETASEAKISIPANAEVQVLLAPLDQIELSRFSLESLGSRLVTNARAHRMIAFTRDLNWLSPEERGSLMVKTNELNFDTLQIHESLDELDSEILVRLGRFATSRMAIEEQKE